jgi:hypothetical protein
MPIVAHHLFPSFASLWLAALLGLGTLATSSETLFAVITKLGVAAALPITAPLSLSTHFMLGVALALIGAALGLASAMHFQSSYNGSPVEAASQSEINGPVGGPVAQPLVSVDAPSLGTAGLVEGQQFEKTAACVLPHLDEIQQNGLLKLTDSDSRTAHKAPPLAMTGAVNELMSKRLLIAAKVVETHRADSLRQAGLPSIEWYDVLATLDRHGPQRPRALQTSLDIEQYTLSRVINRMVGADLVSRIPCIEDGRGHILDLTHKGRAVFGEMELVCNNCLETWFEGRIPLNDRILLVTLLGKLDKSTGI